MNENPKLIHITARDSSEVTGQPHRAAINIAHIIGIEQIMYQYVVNDDEIGWREGSTITVTNCPQFDVRESLDVVLALVRLAAADDDWEKISDIDKNNLQLYWASLEQRETVDIAEALGRK